jgi:hypothetical protein
MILVHLANSYPKALSGEADLDDVTLGNWAKVSDEAAEQYGDLIAGIYRNEIVSIYRILSWHRITDDKSPDFGRVYFEADEAPDLAHFIGTPNPGKPWTQGMSRPVQYLPTDILLNGSSPVEKDDSGSHRAVIGDFILSVSAKGYAHLVMPSGSKLTVETLPADD